MNIDKDIEKINKLYYLLDNVYSTGLIENEERDEYQQAIDNVLSDRETWKNVAEKLAEELTKLTEENKEYYLDWARKEVENEKI